MTTLVEIDNVRKVYKRDAFEVPVLNGVTVNVPSGDFLALDRSIVDVQANDLLAVFDTGAYGYVMASNYNSRRRAAEVLVDGDRFAVVTARESMLGLSCAS